MFHLFQTLVVLWAPVYKNREPLIHANVVSLFSSSSAKAKQTNKQ